MIYVSSCCEDVLLLSDVLIVAKSSRQLHDVLSFSLLSDRSESCHAFSSYLGTSRTF